MIWIRLITKIAMERKRNQGVIQKLQKEVEGCHLDPKKKLRKKKKKDEQMVQKNGQ